MSGRRDPAEGGNWIATLADVKQGYDRLSRPDQVILRRRFRDDWKLKFIGEAEGDRDAAWAHRQVERAVRSLVKILGGDSPWQ